MSAHCLQMLSNNVGAIYYKHLTCVNGDYQLIGFFDEHDLGYLKISPNVIYC